MAHSERHSAWFVPENNIEFWNCLFSARVVACTQVQVESRAASAALKCWTSLSIERHNIHYAPELGPARSRP